jgi:hypothetical protein
MSRYVVAKVIYTIYMYIVYIYIQIILSSVMQAKKSVLFSRNQTWRKKESDSNDGQF